MYHPSFYLNALTANIVQERKVSIIEFVILRLFWFACYSLLSYLFITIFVFHAANFQLSVDINIARDRNFLSLLPLYVAAVPIIFEASAVSCSEPVGVFDIEE